MSYTPNVPQANQTIASTTTPIRNNFTFINTDLQVEHTFNGNTAAAEGTHRKCSMPGIATPSLPAGCDGSYYVSNTTSNAKYVNASNNYTLSIYTSLLRGNVSINLAGTNLPVDPNTAGTVWLYNAAIPFTTTISYYNTGGVTYANTSVVDQYLRVHGVSNLRVIDSSIFPNVTSGNTNASTMMVALRGADMIVNSEKMQ